MNKPIISVIMPVYNAEPYLRLAIESILKQTFRDFEMIIVNDASTDASATIIRRYAKTDPRIHFITHDQNKGLPGALNTALSQAQGKYIARMDQDDISLPDRLKLQFQFLEAHKDITLIGGGYAPFNESGHRINIFHPKSSIEIAWRFISNSYFCHPSIMFRSEALKDIGEYPNVGAEDFAFFSQFVQRYRCTNLQKILIHYREHQTNYSVTKRDKIRESVKKTFQKNYIHYIGNLDHAEAFFRFQRENILPLNEMFHISKINLRILNKIRRQYDFSLLNPEFLRMILLFQLRILLTVFHAR